MRYKLIIEYDGGPFHGFQSQKDLPTVQGFLERALLRLMHKAIKIHGAGRTDQGVHACGQVAHIDLDTDWLPMKLKFGINHFLKEKKISILSVERVGDDFQSRFGAKQKTYLYRILNRAAPVALEEGRVWHVAQDLDAEAMHNAAQSFVGYHDFSSFRDSDCQALSPLRQITRACVIRRGEELHITFQGRSFLHHQVRNMVGTLKLLGHGRLSLEDITTIMHAKDRRKAGPTAPPEGLYLIKIDYE